MDTITIAEISAASLAVLLGLIFVFRLIKSKQSEQAPLVTLEEALRNTKKGFFGKISAVFTSTNISSQNISELEEILYTSDLGPKTVQRFLSLLEDQKEINLESVKALFKNEMTQIFSSTQSSLDFFDNSKAKSNQLQIWMVVGVNGAGKTTTIGKLAHHLAKNDLKVMIAAGDTFRAAAKDQLQVWAERSGVAYFSPPGVDSPSAVAFDACKKAHQEKFDILIVDTAGRLHTQSHLMDELKKMKRVISNHDPKAPQEVLIVLDANSGQNALVQAKQFHDALNLTGVVLTKLDGTAKGGVALGVVNELQVPIKLIGVGEKVEDLRQFVAQEFIDSIL